jgi:hypothetical protein
MSTDVFADGKGSLDWQQPLDHSQNRTTAVNELNNPEIYQDADS